MTHIRIALIGAGIFARDTYIPNLEANGSRSKLTAILSRSAEPIDEALSLLNGGNGDDGTVKKYVGEEGESAFFAEAVNICEAVIIVVPIPLLAKYVELCMRAGLHILSEKPVAMTSVTAAELIFTYRQLRKERPQTGLWHVAENYRLEPAIEYANELVKAHSSLPKTFTMIALRQQSPTAKYAVTTWRQTPDYAGSFVLDGGIHFVAMMRAVLGGNIANVKSRYFEHSVVECGTCGSCSVGDAIGTFHIQYGAFETPVFRFDVYFPDAVMSIAQIKGVGYEVSMSQQQTRKFPFGGLQKEFSLWLESITTASSVSMLEPEESLVDLLVIERMIHSDG